MKYIITYLPFVYDDIKEINAYYNIVRKGFGKQFVNNYKREIKVIILNPLLYQVKYGNTRVAFIETFPYGIHFEILENTNTILVKAVLHTSRNPEIWENR